MELLRAVRSASSGAGGQVADRLDFKLLRLQGRVATLKTLPFLLWDAKFVVLLQSSPASPNLQKKAQNPHANWTVT